MNIYNLAKCNIEPKPFKKDMLYQDHETSQQQYAEYFIELQCWENKLDEEVKILLKEKYPSLYFENIYDKVKKTNIIKDNLEFEFKEMLDFVNEILSPKTP